MRSDYDWSEAWDIYRILRCLGAGEVVDVGCGGGLLVGFLRSRGFKAVGCDISTSDPGFRYCDVRKPETVPTAVAWVLQHVLEHVPREAWRPLFERAWSAGVEHIVIIVPGHISSNPSHVCNHFVLSDTEVVKGLFGEVKLCRLGELVGMLRSVGYDVRWFPDSHSVDAPWDLDYVVVATRAKRVALRLAPWIAGSNLAVWFLLRFLRRVRLWGQAVAQ